MDEISKSQIVVVLITAPSKEVGKQIARVLVEHKIAACVNILSPINSLYVWAGQFYDEEEVLLIAKTRIGLFDDKLVPTVKAIHPYEVPEIIALPVEAGLHSYLNWIAEATGVPSD